jgi:hypothetical protein
MGGFNRSAAQDRAPIGTFYSWMTDLHPRISEAGAEQGVTIEVAPTENFGIERFLVEAGEGTSTWDFYGGVTPFLEMIQLVESGAIGRCLLLFERYPFNNLLHHHVTALLLAALDVAMAGEEEEEEEEEGEEAGGGEGVDDNARARGEEGDANANGGER